MTHKWLRHKLSIEEAERENLVVNEQWPEGKPFGFIADQWQQLLVKMQPGDELWWCRSDDSSWEELMGWEGVAVVRDGQIVDSICTGLN